jgi:hypothetical protein
MKPIYEGFSNGMQVFTDLSLFPDIGMVMSTSIGPGKMIDDMGG